MALTSSASSSQLRRGRWLVWGLTALLFVLLPLAFRQGFALTLMSQMGIMIIFALSYNMLLGQSGMLSFGHAVYSGLGAFFAMHALKAIGAGTLAWPVSLLPLTSGYGFHEGAPGAPHRGRPPPRSRPSPRGPAAPARRGGACRRRRPHPQGRPRGAPRSGRRCVDG